MSFQIQKAQRQRVFLKINMSGVSGSGKTYSALLMARGMVSAWNKINLIDTENNSSQLYSHLGDFNVIPFAPPYSPERYVEAIKYSESLGPELTIVDSISHEWDGKGGCLEIHEALTAADKYHNSFNQWAKITPRHRAFVDAILQSQMHVITCARRKTEWEITKDDKGRNQPVKVGLKMNQREGFDYEVSLDIDLAQGNYASISKTRIAELGNLDPFIITEDFGKRIMSWNMAGAVKEKIHPMPADLKEEQARIMDSLNGYEKEFSAEFPDATQKYKSSVEIAKKTNDWADCYMHLDFVRFRAAEFMERKQGLSLEPEGDWEGAIPAQPELLGQGS